MRLDKREAMEMLQTAKLFALAAVVGTLSCTKHQQTQSQQNQSEGVYSTEEAQICPMLGRSLLAGYDAADPSTGPISEAIPQDQGNPESHRQFVWLRRIVNKMSQHPMLDFDRSILLAVFQGSKTIADALSDPNNKILPPLEQRLSEVEREIFYLGVPLWDEQEKQLQRSDLEVKKSLMALQIWAIRNLSAALKGPLNIKFGTLPNGTPVYPGRLLFALGLGSYTLAATAAEAVESLGPSAAFIIVRFFLSKPGDSSGPGPALAEILYKWNPLAQIESRKDFMEWMLSVVKETKQNPFALTEATEELLLAGVINTLQPLLLKLENKRPDLSLVRLGGIVNKCVRGTPNP